MKKWVVTLMLALGFGGPALAWQPTKTVEVTVPFPAGSGNDLIARTMVEAISQKTNIKFVINNKGGAGGVVGSTYFVKQPADGHHLNLISVGGIAAMDYTFSAPYTVSSFDYVTGLAFTSVVIIAGKNDPVNNPKDLAKVLLTEEPSIGDSGGAGKLGLESVLVNLDTRNKNPRIIRVDHRGPAESVSDVIGGHVRFAAVPLAVAIPHHKQGSLKIVALTQQEKNTEHNLPGFAGINNNINANLTWGLAAPKDTSKEAKEFWARTFNEAKNDPSVQKTFALNSIYVENQYNTPELFTKHINDQYKNLAGIVKIINDSKK